jgi:hypothetical protein
MGWLFAVALGLHRQSRRIVVMSWAPIALGHAVSIAVVVFAVLALGLALDYRVLGRVAGAVLLGWALWHGVRGHRQRLRVGMQTGIVGLTLWSFLMASAHGAGLMLVPAVLPLCHSGSSAAAFTTGGTVPIAMAAVALHTAAMLATMAMISVVVYDWVGVAFLRWGWINLDLIWVAALGACGALLLLS